MYTLNVLMDVHIILGYSNLLLYFIANKLFLQEMKIYFFVIFMGNIDFLPIRSSFFVVRSSGRCCPDEAEIWVTDS